MDAGEGLRALRRRILAFCSIASCGAGDCDKRDEAAWLVRECKVSHRINRRD